MLALYLWVASMSEAETRWWGHGILLLALLPRSLCPLAGDKHRPPSLPQRWLPTSQASTGLGAHWLLTFGAEDACKEERTEFEEGTHSKAEHLCGKSLL